MLLQQILKPTMAQYMRSELEPCTPAAPMDSPADTHLQALRKESIPENQWAACQRQREIAREVADMVNG